jgi:tetratricopeptide (TPR) repeat protein
VQAAGSSLLYSEEFYSLIRLRLEPDGIMQQWVWIPEGKKSTTLAAVTTSITRSFPYILMYRSIPRGGYHYLASMSPIHIPTPAEAILHMPKAARDDRLEWESNSEEKLMEIWSELLKGRVEPAFFTMSPDIHITDDRPFNEYYLLRYLKKFNFQSFISWMIGLLRSDPALVRPFFISNNPYADAYFNKGNAYVTLGQYRRAIDEYDEAIHLKPDYAEANNNRGTAYAKLGQYKLAIENFNEAIRLKPYYADAYNNRAMIYLNQGNKKLGCYDAQKACEIGNCKISERAKGKGLCR